MRVLSLNHWTTRKSQYIFKCTYILAQKNPLGYTNNLLDSSVAKITSNFLSLKMPHPNICVCARMHFYRYSYRIYAHMCVCVYVCVLHAKLLQSCPTLCNPMDCSPPASSVCRILHVRILELVAVPFSRGSSRPRDQTCISYISCTGRQVLYH